MDGPSALKRKRIVTACSECHRRKQKCNREQPCNVCVSRNVADKCFYNHGMSLSADEDIKPSLAQISAASYTRNAPEPHIAVSELSLLVGYSAETDDTAFTGLQKSLKGDALPIAGMTPCQSLHSSIKEEFVKLTRQIPSVDICKQLIDGLFLEANWYFCILEKYYFMQHFYVWSQMVEGIANGFVGNITRDMQHFPALLIQSMAVALQFSPLDAPVLKILHADNLIACDRVSYQFSKIGMEFMTLLGRHNPTMTSVRHDLMRSLWLKNCSRGMESWYALGDAVRAAQDIGLHLQRVVRQNPEEDVSETLRRMWYDEYRRRLWVAVFAWESHMNIMLGRPRMINVHDITIIPPLDRDIPEDPSKIVPTPLTEHDPPSGFSATLFGYKMGFKCHEMVSNGINKQNLRDYSLVSKMHNEVLELLDALPAVLRPNHTDFSWDLRYPNIPKQRQQVLSAANSFLMALHRPHINTHHASYEAALKAALDCLESQQVLFELVPAHLYKIYSFSFYSIDSGIFLAGLTIEKPPTNHATIDNIQRELRKAVNRLTVMKDRSPMAATGAHILAACLQKITAALQGTLQTHHFGTNQVHEGESSTMLPGYATGNEYEMQQINMAPNVQRRDDNIGLNHDLATMTTEPAAWLDPITNDFDVSIAYWLDYLNQFPVLDPTIPISDTEWNPLLG